MISIIYLTNRIDPKFEWFVDSLYNQTSSLDRADMELIFVDAVLEKEFSHNKISRKELLRIIIDDRFSYKHIAPKENIYQGLNRKTKTEFFAPANARNTGAKAAQGDFLAFVDDVSILMPKWWAATKKAWHTNLTTCGSYQKHFEMNVESGTLVNSRSETMGRDARWNQGNDDYPVRISGQQLYGCSLAIKKEIYNSIGGFDEICDSIGGEDYHFGVRLNFAGHQIYYDRSMFTVESEELHNQPYLMLRDDRLFSPEKYMERLKEFGVNNRYQNGNWDSSHMILDILYGMHHIKSIGIDRNCDEHWFDKKLLAEL